MSCFCHDHRRGLLTAAFIIVLAVAAGTRAQDDETIAIERGSLELRVDRPARLDAAERHKVILRFDAYGGGFKVAEVLKEGGAVAKGEPLLRFDPEEIDRQIRDAKIAMETAERNLSFAHVEQAMLAESNQVRRERAAAALRAAQHALEIFERYRGERMVEQAELRVRQGEYGLADQKEELAQLEKMYDESTLASETKEIVIARNRRQIEMSERYLQFSRDDLTIVNEFEFPDQKLAVEQGLRWATIEDQHAGQNAEISESRKTAEVAAAERALEDARRRVARLESDREQVELAAPADGILTAITLSPGDAARADQVIAEVVDPSRLVVTFNAQPQDLRVLQVGGRVTIAVPAFPEIDASGEVLEIAPIGVAQGETTIFPVRIALEQTHPLLRVGLNCTVQASSTLEDVISVPRSALREENGRYTAFVSSGDGAIEERDVRIGAGSGERVQIIEGLEPGERILAMPPKEE